MAIKENMLWIVVIGGLMLLIFLAVKNITGFVVGFRNVNNNYIALADFLIVLIASFYLIHLNNRKNKKI